jgi:7-keto-8-aminopelargonate synthetase-like enzyme
MQFLESAKAKGLPTGLSAGYSIVPIITSSSIKAARLSHELSNQGIAVQPILYPAVAENAARLRFFVSSEHSENDISRAVETLSRVWGKY